MQEEVDKEKPNNIESDFPSHHLLLHSVVGVAQCNATPTTLFKSFDLTSSFALLSSLSSTYRGANALSRGRLRSGSGEKCLS